VAHIAASRSKRERERERERDAASLLSSVSRVIANVKKAREEDVTSSATPKTVNPIPIPFG